MVVIADEDPAIREMAARLLGDDCDLRPAATTDEVIVLLDAGELDMLVVDQGFAGNQGLRLLARGRSAGLEFEAIVTTGEPCVDTITEIVDLQVYRYLTKPLDRSQFVQSVRQALERRRLRQDLKRHAAELETKNAELTRALDALRRAQQIELEQERLASVGILAAGIAHEINNPVAFLSANWSAMPRMFAELEGLRPDGADSRWDAALAELRDIHTDCGLGISRIQALARDVTTFGRHDVTREPLDVNAIVESTLRMCRYQIQRQGRLETQLGSPPAVTGSSQQLGQVLLNLLLNAAQATSEKRVNVITVRTLSTPDGGAEIQVEDTGSGISDTRRIWDPFYTTKPKEIGTGLGLCIVRRIVGEHGGRIEVHSDPGRGTRFRIMLPGASRANRAATKPGKGLPRVLLLDDESLLLRSLKRSLGPAFDVLTATSVRDAMEVVRCGALDAVVSDIHLPESNGIEFYRWVEEEAAPLADRFLFLTGSVRRLADVPEMLRDRVLFKPCPEADLLAALRRIVESAPAAPG